MKDADRDRVTRRNASIENIDLDEEVVIVGGQRYTEADAADEAAWAEQAAARHRNLIPGGKSISGKQIHSPVLNVRVSEDMKDALEAEAQANGVGVSKLVRQILAEHLRAS